MLLKSLLESVNKQFRVRKSVDFEEFNIHVELMIMTTVEEITVHASLKEYEGGEYFEALKRHTLAMAIRKFNDMELNDTIEYEEGSEIKSKSRFLYLVDYLKEWPSLILDKLFEAYTNMTLETEDRARKTMKFETYKLAEPPQVEKEPKFKPVKEAKPELTPTEKLNKQVEKEIENANESMSNTLNASTSDALNKR